MEEISLFDSIENPEVTPSIASDSPASTWEEEAAKHALDELFKLTFQYKASAAFKKLINFVGRFRFYSPYNAMLIHTQMPGAVYVAPPSRWLRKYGRTIKPGTQTIVILQPMGPVMFVFDVSDTEPTEGAIPLPEEVEKPFEVRGGIIGDELKLIMNNAIRDGIRITPSNQGSQAAGSIMNVDPNSIGAQRFQSGLDQQRNPIYVNIPLLYELLINGKMSSEAQYATIVHELAHLYCGHLGTPNIKWWPDRRGLTYETREFEAESVTYLVCTRAGIDNPSEEYLSDYVKEKDEVPQISLECIMKSAGLIESMSKQRMKLRKSESEKEHDIRQNQLLLEFDKYREMEKLPDWMSIEALSLGFKNAWQTRDYATIIAIGQKIPEEILVMYPKLQMWYDQALTRSGEVERQTGERIDARA